MEVVSGGGIWGWYLGEVVSGGWYLGEVVSRLRVVFGEVESGIWGGGLGWEVVSGAGCIWGRWYLGEVVSRLRVVFGGGGIWGRRYLGRWYLGRWSLEVVSEGRWYLEEVSGGGGI